MYHNRVAQPVACKVINEMTEIIAGRWDDFVSWPDEEEQEIISRGFYQMSQIPNIVGVVDGSHLSTWCPVEPFQVVPVLENGQDGPVEWLGITRPEREQLFRDRRHNELSLNIVLAVDHRFRII